MSKELISYSGMNSDKPMHDNPLPRIKTLFRLGLPLALLTQTCCSEHRSDAQLNAKETSQRVNYTGAEKDLILNISNTVNGPSLDSCYQALFDVYRTHLRYLEDSILTSWQKTHHATASKRHRKGSITISFISKIRSAEIDDLTDRYTKTAEQYFVSCRNAPGRERALTQLLTLYMGRDSSKHTSVARTLLSATDPRVRELSRECLAAYAHAEGNLELALDYYGQLADSARNSPERAEYLLYSADCYFNLGRTTDGLATLEKVKSIEKDNPDEHLRTIAELWYKTYSSWPNKDRQLPEKFMFFELQ
jgi:tetratricopeptide (TPR) repeat protein